MKKTLNLKISATSASLISSGVKAVEEKQLNMEDGATTFFQQFNFCWQLLRKFIDFGIIVHVCYCCLPNRIFARYIMPSCTILSPQMLLSYRRTFCI